MKTRPAGVEWATANLAELEDGTPLLLGGQLVAGYRDATFLRYLDVSRIKQRHIMVVSHRIAMGSGTTCEAAACDPVRIMLDDEGLEIVTYRGDPVPGRWSDGEDHLAAYVPILDDAMRGYGLAEWEGTDGQDQLAGRRLVNELA